MGTPDTEHTLYHQAIQYYRNGDRTTAQHYMRQSLLQDPNHIAGWLWMSALVDDIAQQRECLERALQLDPTSEPAKRGLRILRLRESADAAEHPPTTAAVSTPTSAPVSTPASTPITTPNSEPLSPSALTAQTMSARQAGKLGEYLVEQGWITRKQLDDALEEQRLFWKKSQGVRAPLGNILINNGVLTPEMLASALVNQQRDKLHGREKQAPQYIGEYLVSQGLITAQQLEGVLAEQMRMRQKGTTILLGELLIHAGYITREALDAVLENQRDELFSRFGFED